MSVWIDRTEKIGRFLLWLALAAAVVIVPIEYVGHKREQSKAEADLQEAVKKAEAKADELEKAKERTPRITLASVGTVLSGISYSKAQGSLLFTNVSSRAGVLCIVAVAHNPETKETSESIPACQEVGAYASAVHVVAEFASNDLANTCPRSNCLLTFKEAPEAKE
ncbi:MAG TPA: hypothetical protein VLM85_34450 [Polyangiaceae bacterium]|nr:hypothetical protein [Polyangiaceae bacterium]